MKNVSFLFLVVILLSGSNHSFAQGPKGEWTVGSDFFNRYIWRGSDYGNSPVIQPTLKYTLNGFSVGAWGSYSLSANTSATEADLFLSYAFKNGFSLQVTDYYFPVEPGSTGRYFDYHNAHTFEVTASRLLENSILPGIIISPMPIMTSILRQVMDLKR